MRLQPHNELVETMQAIVEDAPSLLQDEEGNLYSFNESGNHPLILVETTELQKAFGGIRRRALDALTLLAENPPRASSKGDGETE